MNDFEKSKEILLDLMEERRQHIEDAFDSIYRDISKRGREYLNGRLKQRDAVETLFDSLLVLIERVRGSL